MTTSFNSDLRLAAVVLLVSVVSACGGGGDSASLSGPASASASASASSSDSSVQSLSAYQGTWLGVCEAITGGSSVVVGSSQETVVIGPSSASGSATSVSSDRYYTSADCTGSSVALVTDPEITNVAAGTKTIATVTAIKLTVSRPAGNSVASGSAVSIESCNPPAAPVSIRIKLGSGANQLSVCPPLSVPAANAKLILSQVLPGNVIDLASGGVLDSEGYPNSFSPSGTNRYTKQ